MPAQPAWFHRLDEILSALRAMIYSHLDRAAVEKLFRVRQRRARQIMADLEGLRVGNAAAVSREALIARLCRRLTGAGGWRWRDCSCSTRRAPGRGRRRLPRSVPSADA